MFIGRTLSIKNSGAKNNPINAPIIMFTNLRIENLIYGLLKSLLCVIIVVKC